MWIAITIVGLIILGGLIFLASLDGKFQVRRELECDIPIDEIFATVLDFNSWPEWNPWLLHEPGAKIEISPDCNQEGGHYSWDGDAIGAGRLSHVRITPGKRIQQQIEFIRPFKSVNQVNWYFEKRGDSTLVEWEMQGSMPFLFRFMTKSTALMISKDYDLGLIRLCGYLDPNAPQLKISFCGREPLEAFHYWAIPFTGRLRELQASRKTNLPILEKATEGESGLPLTIYHKLDWQQASFEAEFAVPVSGDATHSGYQIRSFKGGEYLRTEVTGDQAFLPLTWYAVFSHCRMHKIKIDSSRHSLEIYHDTKTILYLPLKT